MFTVCDKQSRQHPRHAIVRISELREDITEFSLWADAVVKSNVLDAHDELRRQISSRFPFVFESLRDCGGRIGGVAMPRHLCAQYGHYLEDSFARLMKEVASVTEQSWLWAARSRWLGTDLR